MSSVKGDFCNIGKFEPSGRTKDAIKDMNHVIAMASLLQNILSVVPFFQMFVGRDSFYGVATASAGYQVSTSDWQTFADAIKSVDKMKRARLEYIAGRAELSSMGEEQKFWRCVSNAI